VPPHSVLVTGAAGHLGGAVLAALAGRVGRLAAVDVRDPAVRREGVDYRIADVRDPGLAKHLREHEVETVVHLASIVTPAPGMTREFMHSVDVLGTQNVLDACLAAGVRKIVVSSSGAAYGYHADNPAWIGEEQPLRGNPEFAYAHHKRLVEELLARYRAAHPELQQVVFRIGTVLGAGIRNQITDLFDRPRLLAIRGSDSPFVFVWDEDVAGAIERAVSTDRTGVFNLAGDGALSIRRIAEKLGKRCLSLPAWLIQGALAVLRPLGLTQYGPEQVNFLRYRPVLANRRLKENFGYLPRYTSEQAFDAFLAARRSCGA
jgi:UDP-glucose 4-epimerase